MATCGECKNFIRVDNTACGRCRIRKYLMSRQKRETNREFKPHQSRTACKQFYAEGTTITNYDRIKSMTVDEMVDFMRTMLDCVSCQNKMMNNSNPVGKEKCNGDDYFKMCEGDYRKCLAVCKKWLLQEIKPQ